MQPSSFGTSLPIPEKLIQLSFAATDIVISGIRASDAKNLLSHRSQFWLKHKSIYLTWTSLQNIVEAHRHALEPGLGQRLSLPKSPTGNSGMSRDCSRRELLSSSMLYMKRPPKH